MMTCRGEEGKAIVGKHWRCQRTGGSRWGLECAVARRKAMHVHVCLDVIHSTGAVA